MEKILKKVLILDGLLIKNILIGWMIWFKFIKIMLFLEVIVLKKIYILNLFYWII